MRVIDVVSRDRLNRDDAGQRRQAADLVGRRANLDAVDRVLEGREHFGTLGLGGCNDRLLPRAQIGFDRLSIGLGDVFAGDPAAQDSYRIVSQLEYNHALPLLTQGNGRCKSAYRWGGDEVTAAVGRLRVRDACAEPDCKNKTQRRSGNRSPRQHVRDT